MEVFNNIDTDFFMNLVVTYGPKVLAAIITLVLGLWAVKIIQNIIVKILNKSNVDPSLLGFLKGIIGLMLKVMVYISALGMLGIEMTSFIAVLGAAGLAVGLALQGSLSNFAGGVLILLFKPFKVGDYVERGSDAGTVERIDILYTILVTSNNQTVTIPNGQMANSPVTNYSARETRRAVFLIGIGYDSNVQAAREVILDVLKNDERTLEDPEPVVVLTNLGESSLDLSVRAWTQTSNYWKYFWENLEKIKKELDKAGIEIPYPKRDLLIKKQD